MTTSLRFAAAAAMLTFATAAAAQAPKQISRADYLKTVDSRFNAMDANHDGAINRTEMIAQQQRDLQTAKTKIQQQFQAQFRQLDTNKDGQLSLAEFLAGIPQIKTGETPDQLIQKFDANHDGKVSADEFRNPEMAKFNRIDANRDGIVTQAEMQAAAKR